MPKNSWKPEDKKKNHTLAIRFREEDFKILLKISGGRSNISKLIRPWVLEKIRPDMITWDESDERELEKADQRLTRYFNRVNSKKNG